MKVRGSTGGINILVETNDNPETVHAALDSRSSMLNGQTEIEISNSTNPETLEATLASVRAYGGQISRIKASKGNNAAPAARTEIIARTIRSGTRIEKPGSVIVLGDVNSGVELVAGGDIIVVGVLRGIAHAGATGFEDAIIWANRIASPQLRISGALARSPEGSSMMGMQTKDDGESAEIARLENGQIVIEKQS